MYSCYISLMLLNLAFPKSFVRVRPIDDLSSSFIIDLFFRSQKIADNFRRYTRALPNDSFDTYTYMGYAAWNVCLRCKAKDPIFLHAAREVSLCNFGELGDLYIEELGRQFAGREGEITDG